MVTDKDKLRKTVLRIVEERRMSSIMNDTKWEELRYAMMNEMPFQPPYTVKFLTDDAPCAEETSWHEAYVYEGLFNAALAIEWIKIRPVKKKSRGALIPPEWEDAHDELEKILDKYNIPYEEENGVYCICGYRTLTE